MSRDATLQKWLKDLPQKPAKKDQPQAPAKPRQRRKRLVIYDFDGTIFNSPDRDQGEMLYFEATGQTWPHSGWWGQMETLLPPIVAEKPDESLLIAATVAAYRQDAQDEQTELVLMTGRPYKTKWRVQQILDHFGLTFHDYRYRGMRGQKGRDTLEIKVNIIEGELVHPELKSWRFGKTGPNTRASFLPWPAAGRPSIVTTYGRSWSTTL
jgi:hypothetical protein